MNKVFGYSLKMGKDWFKSDPYQDNEIEAIRDPEGGSETFLPTAIPSPFARMDLVRTAFHNINKSPDLKFYEVMDSRNNSVNIITGREDERLVSHCLDLAELMFNIDTVKDKVNILVWDRAKELETLEKAGLKPDGHRHKKYGQTLDLYLQQDQDAFNFDLLKRLFIIEFNDKVIGATSPLTLFFPTANDLTHAQIRLGSDDILFDDEYKSLYERDPEFQIYLYHLFRSDPVLSRRMKDWSDYLEKNRKILDKRNPELFARINKLEGGGFRKAYAELSVGGANNPVEVLGVPLGKRSSVEIAEFIANNSDFRIASSKYPDAKKPLVLQNDFTKEWLYVKDKWNNTKVPFLDPLSLDKRRLPDVSITYPYVTVGDFLEPYLIRLVYPINKEKFFDGNLVVESEDTATKGRSYLLPLKPAFFNYFDSVDLLKSSPEHPSIRMVQGVGNSVKVTLSIPVSRPEGSVSLERTYYQPSSGLPGKPDEVANKGAIVEHQVGVTLFPFIKTNDPDNFSFYRVQLIDRDASGLQKNANFDVRFFTNQPNAQVAVKAKKIRSEKKADAAESATSQYYVLSHEFDYIQLTNTSTAGASGFIIPKWPPYYHGNEAFSFAVDFGTTNTHIEYKIGTSVPRPFEIDPEDEQIATLFDPRNTTADFGVTGAIAIRELIEDEFIPSTLGSRSAFKFPHRTVISESHALHVDTETYALADFNIPFIYERKASNDKITSNLKWAKREKGNDKRVYAFFEEIMMLFRNKVLLNKGNPASTRLVWFYPSSMTQARIDSLSHAWEELFRQYFHSASQPTKITESLAPFFYFKGAGKLKGGTDKPVVSIDIGGGTTDIVVFQASKPLLLTSFKFAANTLFGDGYAEYGSAKSNGLVNRYYHRFEELLQTNKQYNLLKVLASIMDKNKTEDLNAFFFSIENNPKITEKKLFSYSNMLGKDEDLKILFLYFYSAIIYHVADLMKNFRLPGDKPIDMPKHIIFSGTGSKILSIITPKLATLTELTRLIFEGVSGRPFDSDGLILETEKEMPKEVTCKGGLMTDPEDLDIKVDSIRAVLTCLEPEGVKELSWSQLTDDRKVAIAAYVTRFNDFFLQLHQKMNFTDNFSASSESIEIFRKEANKNIRGYLEQGIEYNQNLDKSTDMNKRLNETLFFYPLIGTINILTDHLTAKNQEKI